jgi:alpha-L-fucosidase
MDELVVKAREKQPGLIVVDRAVYGKNQNYLTPENRVPEKALPYPWESCIIAGGGWSHTFNATYKSGHEAIQMLVDIVSKGGNLLLNIAPGPDGTWQQGAYDLLAAYEKWLTINGEAIYNSHAIAPYKESNIGMTQQDDGTTYFFYMADEDQTTIPKEINITAHQPVDKAKVTLLGSNRSLTWFKQGDGFKIIVPKKLRENPPSDYVWTFKVEQVK